MPWPNRQPNSHRPTARHDAIHRALLTGLLSNLGQRGLQHEYTAPRGTKFSIFPGSALFKANPSWIMAAELVETTKLYARNVAAIRPEWIERAAAHLIKRNYSEPHWHAPSAHVMAFEKLTLRGLVIVPRRRVHYGPIDPRTSREIFIQHALVQGDFKTSADSILHNRDLLERGWKLQHKTRRDDLLTEPAHRYLFYLKRVPENIYDGPAFEQWRIDIKKTEPDLLQMLESDVINARGLALDARLYPDAINVAGVHVDLKYHYEPGHGEDGITAIIPLAALNQMPLEPFEWLAPGQLEEKIDYLIRSLPKTLRILFVPVAEKAEQTRQVLLAGQFPPRISLRRALADYLGRVAGATIRPGDFNIEEMPAHLRMNFRIVDSAGNTVSMGRDLAAIRQCLGLRARAAFAALPSSEWNRDNLTRWDFGDIPPHVEIHHGGLTLTGYPALLDQQNSVALRFFDSPETAAAATRSGQVRLFMVQLHKEVEYLRQSIPNIEQLCLYYAPLGSCETLRAEIIRAAADRALFENGPYVRTRTEFIERAESGWRHLSAATSEIQAIVSPALASYQELAIQLNKPVPPLLRESIEDMRAHLSRLMPPNFLAATPFAMLVHLPRFLHGLQLRLKKLLTAGAVRDIQLLYEVRPFEERYKKRTAELQSQQRADTRMEQFRLMLEEFRVSLFAQELRTSMPISAARLDAYWQSLGES